jgi:two-component system, response regulator PdtaR
VKASVWFWAAYRGRRKSVKPPTAVNSAKLQTRLKRALIIEASRNSAKTLIDIVRALGGTDIRFATDAEAGWETLQMFEPDIIFCEYSDQVFGGPDFVKHLRRSSIVSRKAPVVMVATGITKTMLDSARDAGVDELMMKPYAMRDVERRAAAVLLNARPWIEAVGYIGPDRRRFNSSEYKGARRRKVDKGADGLEQAVRIMVSSINHLDNDRSQALRSIITQLSVIVPALKTVEDPKVREAMGMIIAELRTPNASRSVMTPFAAILATHVGIEPDERAQANAATTGRDGAQAIAV